ncbi:MAG: translation initiation factor IF-2 [Candidatus Riflebacteria bacterium]|nr:translation initiation factor IF-2 [Candidatus Riflebacteria bacterium]
MSQQKMRLYELAKELGVSSKELLDRLASYGIMNLKNFSALDDPVVARARSFYKKVEETKKPTAADAGRPQVARAVVAEEPGSHPGAAAGQQKTVPAAASPYFTRTTPRPAAAQQPQAAPGHTPRPVPRTGPQMGHSPRPDARTGPQVGIAPRPEPKMTAAAPATSPAPDAKGAAPMPGPATEATTSPPPPSAAAATADAVPSGTTEGQPSSQPSLGTDRRGATTTGPVPRPPSTPPTGRDVVRHGQPSTGPGQPQRQPYGQGRPAGAPGQSTAPGGYSRPGMGARPQQGPPPYGGNRPYGPPQGRSGPAPVQGRTGPLGQARTGPVGPGRPGVPGQGPATGPYGARTGRGPVGPGGDTRWQGQRQGPRMPPERSMGGRGRSSYKRAKAARREEMRAAAASPREDQVLKLDQSVVVGELAKMLKVGPGELISKLLSLGTMASLNQRIDIETATIVAAEFGYKVESVSSEESELIQQEDSPESLKPRPPVVTIMGHVDHGKTTLLDAIRNSDVAGGEAGGITQHIGAYQVILGSGQTITFLDTPGHEAFTAMRAHGAQVTDLAVLVVAADDGVMPQTEEAVHHAQAANVPILVAINKVDKVGANPEKVKQQLTSHGLVAEAWGGKTVYVPVSAKERKGISDLLEMITLQAEMMDLRANPAKAARGTTLEARVDRGKGPVATVLIHEGTLKVGDVFVAGQTMGKVRALEDYRGERIKEALPGTPVEVMGFEAVPEVADTFSVVDDEAMARSVVSKREARHKSQIGAPAKKRATLEDLYQSVKEGKLKELKIVLRADVQGSAIAVKEQLEKLSNEEVRISVIHSGVGAITETDVMFAAASDAIILGFHVRPSPAVSKLAVQEGVEMRLYSIIYEAVDEMKSALKGMLEPKYREVVLGQAEIRKVFSIPKVGKVAGCYVTDGKVARHGQVRVIRDGVEVFTGKLASLRRFSDDAKEVAAGLECGMAVENFLDVKEKDIIEVFELQEVKQG